MTGRLFVIGAATVGVSLTGYIAASVWAAAQLMRGVLSDGNWLALGIVGIYIGAAIMVTSCALDYRSKRK